MLRPGTVDVSGSRFYDFRPQMLAAPIRIVWPDQVGGEPSMLAILPNAVAQTVVALGYARAAGDDDVLAWNAVINGHQDKEPLENAPDSSAQAEIEAGGSDTQAQPNDAPAAKPEAVASTSVAATTEPSASPRAPAGKRPTPKR